MAVVLAHAARADAAEGHVVLGDVEDAVVDRDAAGDRAVENRLLELLVVGEEIEAERAVLGVHVRDHLVDVAVRLHRQQRAEDLLAHDRHVVGRIENDRGRDLALRVVERGVGDERHDACALLFRVLERAAQAAIRFLVDDRRVAAVVRVGVALGDDAARGGDERVALRLGHEDVVGREAGLPGVHELAVHDAVGGGVDVEVVADDRRRLATELERHRRQALGGGAHDGTARVGGAGEDDVIEGQSGEVLGADAGQDRDRLLGELGFELLGEEAAERARVRRHLDHAAIAGGERARERADRQEERVVPRRHDPDEPLRLRDHAVRAGREQDRDVAALRLHPLAELLPRVADAVDRGEDLEQLRLLGAAAAEVGVDRLGDRVDVLDEDALELVEVLPALLVARVRVAKVRRALDGEYALRFVLDDVERAELSGLGHGILRDDRARGGRRTSNCGRAPAEMQPTTLAKPTFR